MLVIFFVLTWYWKCYAYNKQNAKLGFMKTLDKFIEEFLTKATEEIKKAMDTNLFEDMGQMVNLQSTKFTRQTKGMPVKFTLHFLV